MRVTVTQEDIDKGICDNTRSCAIAQALAKKTGKGVRVMYDEAHVYPDDDKDITEFYRLSRPARQFILRFDSGDKNLVKPATFTLTRIK